jgi:hypothetical protein
MKLMRKAALAATAAALIGLASTAQAALFDRGGGMIYDSTLNITWLKDWNVAGRMDWATANTWANNLVYGGFDDWRLPTSLNADGSGPCGPAFDCTGSEMGHMFYTNWGASAGSNFATGTNAANLALFSNVQSFYYWSGTEYALGPNGAWLFLASVGLQGHVDKTSALYAVAVRPGDVVAVVPEPKAYALMLMCFGALMVVARRRPR